MFFGGFPKSNEDRDLQFLLHVLAEDLFALFASKDHLGGLAEGMVCCFTVTFCTVEPKLAAWGADGGL